MKVKQSGILFILLLLFFFSSCAPTKHLEEDEYLLRRVKLDLKTDRTLSDKGALQESLQSLYLQNSNTYIFNLFPYKAWLYNLRYEKYQRDPLNFQITNRVVEQPVVFDSSLVAQTTENMRSFLWNNGYFHAEVSSQVTYKKKKAYVSYEVDTKLGYLIDSLKIDIQSENMKDLETMIVQGTLLNRGKSYSNSLAADERSGITNLIRNQGFYRFSADNISFELDTLNKEFYYSESSPFEAALSFIIQPRIQRNPALNIKTIIHPSSDSLAFEKFTFNDVVVFPDYKGIEDFSDTSMIVRESNGISFKYHDRYVNASVLDKKIFIRPGNLYSEENYSQTIRHLNDLGVFQYVRIIIVADQQDSTGRQLNCYILMNPSDKYDFNTNIEISGGDLYVIGTSVNVSLTDKNFFKGANQLTTTLSYGLELDQNKNISGPLYNQFYLFSQNVGLNFRLTFPKFILPVSQNKFSQRTMPKTILDLGANSLERINYFSLQSINTSFGYVWQEHRTKSWTVKPAFMHILNLHNIHPDFQLRMDSVPAIGNSYQETFIEGESIEFVLNREGEQKGKHAYLKLGFEEAGGLISGIKGITQLFDHDLSFRHAQYIRFDFDARQYFVQRNSSLIFRLHGGVGIPYGHSTVLPYIKQYYVGGAYSIRGWRPRILGPGSFYDSEKQNATDNLFIDQSGDIKLEFNTEYRFNMIRLFSGAININGAVFADGGNIWLTRKDEQMPGAHFQFNSLMQDIALSTGAGLRADLGGFLVIRFDWAFPIKKPYISENYGWVIDDIDFGSPTWRRDNLNLNLAIGYPF